MKLMAWDKLFLYSFLPLDSYTALIVYKMFFALFSLSFYAFHILLTEGEDFALNMSTVVIMAGTNRSCVFVSILSSAEVEVEEIIQLGFDPSVQTTIGEPNMTTIIIAPDGSKPLNSCFTSFS